MGNAIRDIPVLLIEDNRDDEWLARWTLNKIGLTDITIARDGHAALLMLHGDAESGIRESCSPDIILLDLRLPKVDGLEVLRRIRNDERTNNITVLILTSSEDPRDKDACKKLGVTAFFNKPLKEEALVKLKLFPVDRKQQNK
jgi:two-component system, response regulator